MRAGRSPRPLFMKLDLGMMLNNLELLREKFVKPNASSRPTPFLWLSGSDLQFEKLEWILDQLQEKGIGGTILGYSHLPNSELDFGAPEPLTESWWDLLKRFVDASSSRGLTVGMQDYGIIGKILLKAAEFTPGLEPGTLKNRSEFVAGPRTILTAAVPGKIIDLKAISAQSGQLLEAATVTDEGILWEVPRGDWILSAVYLGEGQIGVHASNFDPLHPNSGKAVLGLFHERFATELGDRLGKSFTTFFEDELDLGIEHPMWNNLVSQQLSSQGYSIPSGLHGFWHSNVRSALDLRVAHRDVVVALLQKHYFQPIFEWNESHGTSFVMDQLSRGDLELGRKHYEDFMVTMGWFHGPGNDDPDLTKPRNISAFRISSSIAHQNARPLVTNEAFHSSGWGVTPSMILKGVNIDFAAGANQIILHGLNYTTNGGWWEWASPDFHFRQPWWNYSDTLWSYLTKVSEILRAGEAIAEVGILDPTEELLFVGSPSSPQIARDLLEKLSLRAINAEIVPGTLLSQDFVSEDECTPSISAQNSHYRLIVIPGMKFMRQSTLDKLAKFAGAGGKVVALENLPSQTESGQIDQRLLDKFTIAESLGHLISEAYAHSTSCISIPADSSDLIHAHRRYGDSDIYFFVNPNDLDSDYEIEMSGQGDLEEWDPWSEDNFRPKTAIWRNTLVGPKQFVRFTLRAGASLILIKSDKSTQLEARPETSVFDEQEFSEDWELEPQPSLDNTYLDFPGEESIVGVETYFVETSDKSTGPWTKQLVDHGDRFTVLGPIEPDFLANNEPEIVDSFEGAQIKHDVQLRNYKLSLTYGIPSDSYLLDRETGPHGLKGVPSEFLDPAALDRNPVSGQVYFFKTYFFGAGSIEVLRTQGRCHHEVWINGKKVYTSVEISPERFPPWGLRNMTAEVVETEVQLEPGLNEMVVKVQVSSGQPSRVAAVIGGNNTYEPNSPSSHWWKMPSPALKPHLQESRTSCWFRIKKPVGAEFATIKTEAHLLASDCVGTEVLDDGYKFRVNPESDFLCFALESKSGSENPLDSGALLGPVRWVCGSSKSDLKSWDELGLSDFSGTVRYSKQLELKDELPTYLAMRIEGLCGSARLLVNGIEAGQFVAGDEIIRLDRLTKAGDNLLQLEVANTLANLFAHLPSPYSIMQPPGGGVTRVALVSKKS